MTDSIANPNVEERISAGMVDRLAVIVQAREADLKVHVMVKLIGDRFGYEAVFKADKTFLTADEASLDKMFDLVKEKVKVVLSGKQELNAITH